MAEQPTAKLIPFAPRNPWRAIFLTLITFGFYGLIWVRQMHSALDKAKGEPWKPKNLQMGALLSGPSSQTYAMIGLFAGGLLSLHVAYYPIVEGAGIWRNSVSEWHFALAEYLVFIWAVTMLWLGPQGLMLSRRIQWIAKQVERPTGEGMVGAWWCFIAPMWLAILLAYFRVGYGQQTPMWIFLSLSLFAYLVWVLMAFRGFNMLAYWHLAKAVNAALDAEPQETDVNRKEEA